MQAVLTVNADPTNPEKLLRFRSVLSVSLARAGGGVWTLDLPVDATPGLVIFSRFMRIKVD